MKNEYCKKCPHFEHAEYRINESCSLSFEEGVKDNLPFNKFNTFVNSTIFVIPKSCPFILEHALE